jgi:hypothetical protein
MINYLLYIIGFLLGIYILLIIISDKGDIRTLFKNTKEYFENDTNKIIEVKKSDEPEITKVAVVSPPNLKEIIPPNLKEVIPPKKIEPVPIEKKYMVSAENNEVEHTVLTNTDIIDNFNFNKLLKKREMRVLISSYNNDNINNLDWITDNNKYNNNINLKLSSNDLVKEFNNMNPFVNGYNIQNVSIQGPQNIIMYEMGKEISKFSILFMFSHKKFHSINNNLFIIYGVDNKNIVINIKDNEYNNNNYYNVNNDINDNGDMNGEYDKNDINKSINLLNNYHYYENHDILSNKAKEQKSYKLSYFEKLYTIEIIIDDSVYNINDINIETLKRDIIFFGLIMNKEDVVFHLNNTKYEFKRNTDKSIKIGKDPFVINKNKSCEIVLYSFAYFNEAISDTDLKTFKLYNKYKLYGIHNKAEEVPVISTIEKKESSNVNNLEIAKSSPIESKVGVDTGVNIIK